MQPNLQQSSKYFYVWIYTFCIKIFTEQIQFKFIFITCKCEWSEVIFHFKLTISEDKSVSQKLPTRETNRSQGMCIWLRNWDPFWRALAFIWRKRTGKGLSRWWAAAGRSKRSCGRWVIWNLIIEDEFKWIQFHCLVSILAPWVP